MRWAADADAEAEAVLRGYAVELYTEAERVAKRADAPAVGSEYVQQAAATLKLRKDSAAADVMLAVGPALATLAAGVGVAEWTTEASLELSGLMVGGTLATAGVGLLMTGAGIALKMRR
jgi:hypothetical protein